MERFERILRTLIIEEGIDYPDIIKAIEAATSETEQEKILEELCSYVDLNLKPDDVISYIDLNFNPDDVLEC